MIAILSIFLRIIQWISIPVTKGFYGGMSGFVLGFCYGEQISKFLIDIDIKNMAVWELGIILGILSGFVELSFSRNNKEIQ